MVNENKRMYIPEENHQGKLEIHLGGSSRPSLPYPLSVIFFASAPLPPPAAGAGRAEDSPRPPSPCGARSYPGPAALRGDPRGPSGGGRVTGLKKSCFEAPPSSPGGEGRAGAAVRRGRRRSAAAEPLAPPCWRKANSGCSRL